MEVYPNSALVAPIIPANQQLQTAAQTAALQQRSALEAQQTQAAALANEQTQILMQEQQGIQDARLKALQGGQTTQQSNNASSGITNDLSAQPQSTIPLALAPNPTPDESQTLIPGSIQGLTTTGQLANQAALAPTSQIPPMLARVAPNQGAAPNLAPQISAQVSPQNQAAQTPLQTSAPSQTGPVPYKKDNYYGQTMEDTLRYAAQDPRVRLSTLYGLQKEALEREKEQAGLTKQQQEIRDKTNESVVQIGNQYLNLPYDQQEAAFPEYRNRMLAAGMDPGDLPQATFQAAGGVTGIRNFVIHHMSEQHMDEYAKGLDDLRDKGAANFYNAAVASGVNNDADWQKMLNDPNIYTPALWGSNRIPLHYSPEALAALGQTTVAPKDQAAYAENIKKQTAQDISGMNQAQLDAYNAAHPGVPGLPKSVADIPTYTRGVVPIEKQPEYDIQKMSEAQLKQMTPDDWNKQITTASGGDAGLADRTRSLVSSALAGGDIKGARAAIKDATDQVGRVQVAKEEAKNRVVINAGGLAGGPNGEPSVTAKMVANYEIPFNRAAFRLTADQQNALNGQIKQVNPNFKATNYDVYQDTEKKFTSGQQANQIRGINTMLGHLSTLNQAADLLDNKDLPALNRIANFWGLQAGKDPVTVYNTIVHRLGPEITNAYIAGGGTAGDRGANESDFNANLGAKQIKSNIGVSANLVGSLIDGFQAQYDRGTFGRGQQQLLTDEAQAARQRFAGQSPVRPNSNTQKTTTVPPAVNKLLSDPKVTPGIHTLSDGSKWMKNQDGSITPR